ncbi:MAG: methyltransferase domain-containing protein [Proteobacteria bacterium]|nr:methyltransferase domain-containing protein [Pseudomonadota bacterium]
MTWTPDVYLNFAAYRVRPVADLLPRITPPDQGVLYDLGCGPGNVTVKLKARWPARTVIGVDSSPEMIETAHRKHSEEGVTFELGNIAAWNASQPAALIFTNAALHWVPSHETLLPRLARNLMPGGVLAVQMPLGQRAPYHTCIDDIAASPRWRDTLAKAHPQTTPLSAGEYDELLAPLMDDIDIWETDYRHVLTGEDPVAAWASGTTLVPYTSLLEKTEAAAFTAAYATAVREAYPPQSDGRTIFTMRRIFIVARRRA